MIYWLTTNSPKYIEKIICPNKGYDVKKFDKIKHLGKTLLKSVESFWNRIRRTVCWSTVCWKSIFPQNYFFGKLLKPARQPVSQPGNQSSNKHSNTAIQSRISNHDCKWMQHNDSIFCFYHGHFFSTHIHCVHEHPTFAYLLATKARSDRAMTVGPCHFFFCRWKMSPVVGDCAHQWKHHAASPWWWYGLRLDGITPSISIVLPCVNQTLKYDSSPSHSQYHPTQVPKSRLMCVRS